MKRKGLLVLILVPLLVISLGGIAVGRWVYVQKQVPFDVAVPDDKTVIPALVKIDPDTISLGTKGDWITAYIEISERPWFPDVDVAEININTVKLNIYLKQNNKIPAENSPDYAFVTDSSLYITDYDDDGKLERMVKFSLTKAQDILYIGNGIPIEVTGSLNDGRPLYGLTFVNVRGRFWLFE